jgi:membrane protease YdiL (CAAX protease family)
MLRGETFDSNTRSTVVLWREGDAYSQIRWNSILGTSLLIGFVEEISYRGFILQKLQQRLNFWVANLISSLLFLGIHFPGWLSLHMLRTDLVVSIFIFGAVMAIVFRYSKSLSSVIVAHSLNDFLSFIIFHR